MSDEPVTSPEAYDDELSILNHAVEYMNDADDRAKERLLFYLTHRYFPEGSFAPKRLFQ